LSFLDNKSPPNNRIVKPIGTNIRKNNINNITRVLTQPINKPNFIQIKYRGLKIRGNVTDSPTTIRRHTQGHIGYALGKEILLIQGMIIPKIAAIHRPSIDPNFFKSLSLPFIISMVFII
jgi:hypothetical protein